MLARPTNGSHAKPIEYLYSYHDSEIGGGTYWTSHQIIKKTAKRIFIADRDSESLSLETLAKNPEYLKLIQLDRQKLESEGRIYRDWTSYYTEAGKQRYLEQDYQPRRQPCFEFLGLSSNCSRQDIKRAYRRVARELHPDKGGDARQFIALKENYERALQAERH